MIPRADVPSATLNHPMSILPSMRSYHLRPCMYPPRIETLLVVLVFAKENDGLV